MMLRVTQYLYFHVYDTKRIYCILALLALCSFKGMAQAVKTNIVPEGYQKAQLYEGDTMAVVNLQEVFIYPQVKFKNSVNKRSTIS